MADEQPSPLQRAIREKIAASGKARDHFDTKLRERLSTKGKPLYDIDRGKSKNPRPDVLDAIEEVLGFRRGELLRIVHPSAVAISAAPDLPVAKPIDAGETVGIEQLDLSLSMGPGTEIGDYVEGSIVQLDLALVRSITRSPPERLKLVSGHGHSMEPTLHGSDMILIDTTDRALARQDGIYWIDYFGAAGLKRLRTIGPGRVMIISDNKAVGDYEVAAEDLRIEGRAVWFARGL